MPQSIHTDRPLVHCESGRPPSNPRKHVSDDLCLSVSSPYLQVATKHPAQEKVDNLCLLRFVLRFSRPSALGFPQTEVSSASSQSFQTGSRFWLRNIAATSAALRVSWIWNCSVAFSQPDLRSSSTRRPLMVR